MIETDLQSRLKVQAKLCMYTHLIINVVLLNCGYGRPYSTVL